MKYNFAFQLNCLPVAFIHYFPNSFSGNSIHKLVCNLFSVDVDALPDILLEELLSINNNFTEKDNLEKIKLGFWIQYFPIWMKKKKWHVLLFYFI